MQLYFRKSIKNYSLRHKFIIVREQFRVQKPTIYTQDKM
jgi:hypothetical protein